MTDRAVELVERVARAIRDQLSGKWPLSVADEFPTSIEAAQAAIAAIQGDHPTPQDLLNKAEAERDRAREELARVREMGDALAGAVGKLGLRTLVSGWNGEQREGGPYDPHPAKLGVTLPTKAGVVYAIDQALAAWNAR